MSKANSIVPFPADIDRSDFGHWLSGFVDGEGCFCLGFFNRKHQTPFALFSLSLRDDDQPILERIRSFWQCGRIHPCSRSDLGKRKPVAQLHIREISHLLNVVIPHFDRFPLRAKKARDFVTWKEGVSLIFSVSRRKQISNGNRGFLPLWGHEERERFRAICHHLKEQRAYSSAASPLPSRKPNRPTLFDGLC